MSAVEYAYTKGLFSGTGADTFSPNLTMNRAMLVTVFYRLAGSPAEELSSAQASFADVAEDSWYAPYVRWGYVQGVTAGTGDGRFAPEESVTRQQILVMLHSFAQRYLGPLPHRGGGSVRLRRWGGDRLLGPGCRGLGGGQPDHRALGCGGRCGPTIRPAGRRWPPS